MNETNLNTYLGAILPDAEGWLCTALGRDPYRDDAGKYKHNTWTEHAFRWPQQKEKAAAHIVQAAQAGDVYVCPYPLREAKRRKGSAVQRVLVHADVDGGLDPTVVEELGGFIVASGGAPDRGHVYIRLQWPVTPEQHEALCRGLAAKLGGDHKVSDNDLLRPAGALNWKATVDGGDPTPVLLTGAVPDPVDPRALAEKLGVDLTSPVTHTASRPTATTADQQPVALEKYPTVAAALEDTSGDRSADTFRVLAACRRANLTLDEARWVVNSREDLADRLRGRRDDDVLAVWVRLDDEARIAERLVPASTPPADGADLLDEVRDTLGRFVIFPSESAAIAVTLWVVATHGLPAWQHATRLAIRSPQKRCGKSRLLDVIALLCFNPMASTDASVAVLYRSIGDDDHKTVTLLIDEADALFGTKTKAEQNEDLRSLLNAGFQRGRSVWRCVGPQSEPREFHTFSMAALAAIKGLPDTIVDRAVLVDLKRRQPGETVARFRLRRDTGPLLALRDRLTAWMRDGDRLTRLAGVEPDMPESVTDRQQDAWEPLVAVADEAGGVWPQLARAACLELCAAAEDEAHDVQLLADIKTVFTDMPDQPFLRSVQLVAALKDCDESPWRDEDMTPHRLARALRTFGVRPRPGPGHTARGYYRDDFADAFARYVPAQ